MIIHLHLRKNKHEHAPSEDPHQSALSPALSESSKDARFLHDSDQIGRLP